MSLIQELAKKVKRFTTRVGAKKSLEGYMKANSEHKAEGAILSEWRKELVSEAFEGGNFDSKTGQIVDTTFQPSGTNPLSFLKEWAKDNPELEAMIELAKAEAKKARKPTKRITSK